MTKKTRTLNELRQVKDSVYKTPKVKGVENYYTTHQDFNQQYIVDLIQKYPNDRDLGAKIREYYLHLIKKM